MSKIFVASSYSAQVNYQTGEVFPGYKFWLENILQLLEQQGHSVFCALRADNYKINQHNPAAAFKLDLKHIKQADVLLALLTNEPSVGVQTEIGVAVALDKKVIWRTNPTIKWRTLTPQWQTPAQCAWLSCR